MKQFRVRHQQPRREFPVEVYEQYFGRLPVTSTVRQVLHRAGKAYRQIYEINSARNGRRAPRHDDVAVYYMAEYLSGRGLPCFAGQSVVDIAAQITGHVIFWANVRSKEDGRDNVVNADTSARAENVRIDLTGDANQVTIGAGVWLENCTIRVGGNTAAGNPAGTGNRLTIRAGASLRNTTIEVTGDGHALEIGEGVYVLKRAEFHLRGGGCRVTIGRGTSIQSCSVSATEIETAVTVGEDNMWADNVQLSGGDDHPILIPSGGRRNPARGITVGNHVWLGEGVKLTKGAAIGDGCVVGTRSLVTKSMQAAGDLALATSAVIVGSPARVLPGEPVRWEREMMLDDNPALARKYPSAFAESFFRHGNRAARDGDLTRAVECYKQAIELKGDFAYAFCALGNAFKQLKEIGRAAGCYVRALEINPDYADARRGLDMLPQVPAPRRPPRPRNR